MAIRPIFVTPVAAAVVGALISWKNAAPLAYADGRLGVLIGGRLMNLDRLHDLGAPSLSIVGAGAFAGFFVIGIIAALLAGLTGIGERREPSGV